MKFLFALATAMLAPCYVQAQAAFAHFMVGNTWGFTLQDWENNMNQAKAAKIDAFALNLAANWQRQDQAFNLAFKAAENTGFKAFFSFDYAGNGPWAASEVLRLVQQYKNNGSYYKSNNKPLVSTFEGPDHANDWISIKQTTNCLFIPDWSSWGPQGALAAGNGVADGLFNWNSWAYGPNPLATYGDYAYVDALATAGNKLYMMAISPWFFTNLPNWGKNWAWKGDEVWHDRWNHIFHIKPAFIQIISWNDWGESHYIAPLDNTQWGLFEPGNGNAPFNYVDAMPHDGWRTHLPFLIDTYKNLNPTVGQESVVVWYRKSLGRNCGTGGTTGNTASQMQLEYHPADVLSDNIFVMALLGRNAQLAINTVGNTKAWDYIPDGNVGIYFAKIPMSQVISNGGQVHVIVTPPTNPITVQPTQLISGTGCPNSVTNWNPIVAVAAGAASTARAPATLANQVCIKGIAVANEPGFNTLCQFTCQYDYCPPGACVCTQTGRAKTRPPETGQPGYPVNGDPNYSGLCQFAHRFGFFPTSLCTTTPTTPTPAPFSPFTPPVCRNGTSLPSTSPSYDGLCSYACNFAYCPINVCQCTETGPQHPAPPQTVGGSWKGNGSNDAGLCNFACRRGSYCPAPCIPA
ncbi:mutanase [Podospora australis]|uniref:Mutanase n=1 Tax=Podospora australis TaxID=1536484 RepID=A0AAN7AGA9_9PEZI|nr:mutanase [Podospora australis]